MSRITPFLWFDNNAVEAVDFYLTVFESSGRLRAVDSAPDTPGDEGTPMTVEFTLDGQEFVALNGGPHYTMTPGISFVVSCDSQAEVDHYWDRLGEGGTPMQCGWLTDRFGVTWQVVPKMLPNVLGGSDPAGAQRAMQAMMGMVKLDIAALEAAYAGS